MTAALIVAALLTAPGVSLDDMTFENLAKEKVTVSFPADMPTVFMLADRGGSDHVDPWEQKLKPHVAGRAAIRGVAKLDSVPSFARGMARKIVESKGVPQILMDWENALGSQVGYVDGVPLIIVVSPDGTVVHEETGRLTDVAWARVSAALESLLEASESEAETVAPPAD